MSFLDSVVLPQGQDNNVTDNSTNTKSNGGSFLDNVVSPPSDYIAPPAPPEKVGLFQSVWNAMKGGFNSVQDNTPTIDSLQTKEVAPHLDSMGRTTTKDYSQVDSNLQKQFYDKTIGNFTNTIKDTVGRFDTYNQVAMDQHSSALQKGVALGEAGVGVLNTVFSPITSAMGGLESIPIIGHVANGINRIFSAIGSGGSELALQGLDRLPISQQTKDELHPLVSELSALATQVIAGKLGTDVMPKIKEKSTEILNKINQDVQTNKGEPLQAGETPSTQPVITPNNVKGGFLDNVQTPQVETTPTEVKPVETPVNAYHGTQSTEITGQPKTTMGKMGDAFYLTIDPKKAESFGKEKNVQDNIISASGKEIERTYRDPNAFPSSNVFNFNTSGLKIKTVANDKEFFKFVHTDNIKDAPDITKLSGYDAIYNKDTGTFAVYDTSKLKQVKPIKTEGETSNNSNYDLAKQSKIGASIEQKAVDKGLTKTFGGIAGYDPITIKDQAMRASDLMKHDYDKAVKMVKGEIPMEGGLRAEMLIKAMEDHAEKIGDVQLMKDIANSPLVSETSVHAQAMRLMAERNPDSVTMKIREVQKAREEAINKKVKGGVKEAKEKVVSDIKKEILGHASKRPSWEEFIKEVQCGY